ncbi:ABC transporter substrate-binding protein [Dietzia cinnamea]|nr:ABC transporter substrate-binding protein [Dietzia cinnamea]
MRSLPRRSRSSRHVRAALVITAMSSLVLSGCVTAGSNTPAAHSEGGQLVELSEDDQVEIVFESYNLSGQGMWGDTIAGLIDSFEQEHPNITVVGQGVDSGNATSSVQQQVLAGDPPDIGQMVFNSMAFSAESLGGANLSELVGQEKLDEHFGGKYPFHPRAKVLADIDGATYGLPYVFSTPILWINEDLIEEAGMDPETIDTSTWESVADIADQVTEHTGRPSLSNACVLTTGSWCMQSMFLSNGAQVLSDDRSTIEFGSDAAVDTVDVFKTMYEDGILSNEDEMSQYDTFARGDTYAFQVTSSALQSSFMQGAEGNDWTLDTRVLPQFGEQPAVPTNSGSALVMFSQDPKKQAAAWEFMKWMTSPEAYEQITTGIGYLPLRSSMTEEGGPLHDFVEANPLVKPNLEQLDELSPWVSYPGDQFAQIDELLGTAIEDSVFQGADPAQRLPETAERSQQLLER